MNKVEIKGNTGSLCFDFENEKVIIEQKGILAKTIGLVSMEIPFLDITGIELKKHSAFSSGTLVFIINGKRLVVENDNSISATQFISKSKSEYEKICKCVDRLKELKKDIEIKGENGFDVTKVIKYPDGTEGREIFTSNHEFRKRCNVCGKVYCYTVGDLEKNKQLVKDAKRNVVSSLFVPMVMAGSELQRADRNLEQVKDYRRCPYCNSADIVDITEEEFKAAQQSNAPVPAAVSSADELKKYKELLDSGVINQEEFDAKKKQLLGL